MKRIINFILKVFFFIIFFLIVTPVGILLKLVGVDYLRHRIEKSKDSYWIEKSL